MCCVAVLLLVGLLPHTWGPHECAIMHCVVHCLLHLQACSCWACTVLSLYVVVVIGAMQLVQSVAMPVQLALRDAAFIQVHTLCCQAPLLTSRGLHSTHLGLLRFPVAGLLLF